MRGIDDATAKSANKKAARRRAAFCSNGGNDYEE
jgi:hypothetical protein